MPGRPVDLPRVALRGVGLDRAEVGARARWVFQAARATPLVLALAGCTGGVVVEENGPDGVNAGSGLGPGSSGMDPSSGGASGHGGSMVPSMRGGATSAPVGGSTAMGSGGNSTGPAGASTGMPGGATPSMDCTAITPGPSPLRRLTTHEYNNTVRDLLGDTTSPGHALPAQADSKH